jgi:hypothetical protein
MKNFKYLLILSLAITLFSCKKDDSTPVSANADLLGTWTMTAITGSGSGTIVDSSNTTSIPFTAVITGKNITSTVTYTENANVVTTQGTYDIDLVITPTGGAAQTFTETAAKFVDNNPATWTRVATVLTTVDGDDTTAYTLSISGNTMTLAIQAPINTEDGTVTSTGTYNGLLTFTKQ